MPPNTANELTAMTKNSVATAFTYDAWGRTISKARAGHLVQYYYSHGGRLVMAETGDSDDVYYAYNGLGQRIRRSWQDDYSTDYYWNGWSVVNEYFSDDAEEEYGFSKTYVGGLAERAYSGGAYAYYFTDHLGSTEAVYNEAKSRTAGIDYTAWGEITLSEGAAAGITRRYTGHDYDPLTGDYFAPYRFYSPSSHRWLTRDPLGMVDGPNVYGYVRGNPVHLFDPYGTAPCDFEISNAKCLCALALSVVGVGAGGDILFCAGCVVTCVSGNLLACALCSAACAVLVIIVGAAVSPLVEACADAIQDATDCVRRNRRYYRGHSPISLRL